MVDKIKEQLKLSMEHSYTIVKDETIISTMNESEFKEFEDCYDFATKEELFNLLKVYHKEVKRLKLDMRDIINQ